MTMDPTVFAFAIPAVLFAGISKAGFGSGAAFASTSILALVLEPAAALGIMLPLLMVIDAAALRPYWGRWHLRDCAVLIGASLPGVALGAWLYTFADADLFRVLIGAISLLFVLWQWAERRGALGHTAREFPPWVGGLAGLVAGFTSFVSHAGGPAVAMYMLAKRVDKHTYQANSVLIFWAINIFKAVPYTVLGIFTINTIWAAFVLMPVALMGTWIGVRAHKVVPEKMFFALTYTLLVITGTKLLFDGLT